MSDSSSATAMINGNMPLTGGADVAGCNGVDAVAPIAQSTRLNYPLIVVVDGRHEEIVPASLSDEQSAAQARTRLQGCSVPLVFDVRHLPEWPAEIGFAVLTFIANFSGQYTVRSREDKDGVDLFAAVVGLIPGSDDIARCKTVIRAAIRAAGLQHSDAPELAAERIAAQLHEQGVRGYTVAALTKEIKRAAVSVQPTRQASDEVLLYVRAIFPEAPVTDDAVVPALWHLDINGIKQRGAKDGYLIPKPLLITRILRDMSEGVVWLELSWKQGDSWKSRLVRRDQAATARSIVELAAYGLPVTSNNAAHVVQYLAEYETYNVAQLPPATVTMHMGWQGREGEGGFLCGDELITAEENATPITFQGRDDGDVQLAAGFHDRGTMEGWCRAVQPLAAFPRVKLAIYASLVPPLLKILPSPNFVLSFAARTSLGKTTTLRIAASLWGCPDEKEPNATIGTWDGTRTWIERALAARSDLPLILDDTKRARRPEDIAQTLYDATSGRGRGRASLTGTQATTTWTTVMITSGEAPVTSFTQDGGTRARVLEVWGSPFQQADVATAGVVNSVNRGVLENYGHAGPEFVQYLVEHRYDWEGWRRHYERLRQRYERRAGGNSAAGRMAAHFAALRMAAVLAHHALDLPWGYHDIVSDLWTELTTETAEADRALVALQYVLNWAQGRRREFYTNGRPSHEAPHGGWIGRWKETEYVGFLTGKVDEILREGGFEPVPIRRLWHERRWLLLTHGKTVYKTRMGNGMAAWLVAIHWSVASEIMGHDDPDATPVATPRAAARLGVEQGNAGGTTSGTP